MKYFLKPFSATRWVFILFITLSGTVHLKAQKFLDIFGVNEFPCPILIYDSVAEGLSTYILKSSNGAFPQIDPNTTMHYVGIDDNFKIEDTNFVKLPDVSPYHYYDVDFIECWKGKVIMTRLDLSNTSVVSFFFPFAGNSDLCDISKDSVYNCKQLLPDSAFISEVMGTYSDTDSLILITVYNLGSEDTTSEFFRIAVDKTSLQHTSTQLEYLHNGIYYYPNGNPLKLPNGDWFVQVYMDSAGVAWGTRYAVIDGSWQSLKTVVPISTISPQFTKSWLVQDKVITVNSEIKNPFQWQSGDPIEEQLSLIEYDYQLDTITNRYHFDFSSNPGETSHHTAGYTALFNGEYFILAATRANDFSSVSKALVLAAIDTSYNIVGSMILEDTLGSYTPYLDGLINGIAQGANSEEFYYSGYIRDPDVNPGGYTADLLIGELDLSKIGMEEAITVRKQQTWLYPNPSSGAFKLTNTAKPFKSYTYTIVDNNGKEVYRGKVDEAKAAVETKLAAGKYYLVSEGGDVIPFVVK